MVSVLKEVKAFNKFLKPSEMKLKKHKSPSSSVTFSAPRGRPRKSYQMIGSGKTVTGGNLSYRGRYK